MKLCFVRSIRLNAKYVTSLLSNVLYFIKVFPLFAVVGVTGVAGSKQRTKKSKFHHLRNIGY